MIFYIQNIRAYAYFCAIFSKICNQSTAIEPHKKRSTFGYLHVLHFLRILLKKPFHGSIDISFIFQNKVMEVLLLDVFVNRH